MAIARNGRGLMIGRRSKAFGNTDTPPPPGGEEEAVKGFSRVAPHSNQVACLPLLSPVHGPMQNGFQVGGDR